MGNGVEEFRFCDSCGKRIAATVTSCIYCGQPQEVMVLGADVGKKEYIEKMHPSLKKELLAPAIVWYISAGVSMVLACMTTGVVGIVEVLILLGLTLGMHLGMNKICGILLLIYSCLNCLISMASGQVRGILLIIVSVFAVRTLINIDKQYKNFISERNSIH